jgi:predicted nucleotidyltransferase
MLAPFYRSDAQGGILARVLLQADEESLSSVAASTGVPLTTVQREVERLTDSGVFLTRKQGNTRLVRPNPEYPLLTPLRQIVAATHGPQQVVKEAFTGLDGVELVAIFGSWAARMAGESGPMPADIDVLIVGDVDQTDVDLTAVDASRVIGREVNPVIVDSSLWGSPTNGFIAELRRRPLIVLHGVAPA